MGMYVDDRGVYVYIVGISRMIRGEAWHANARRGAAAERNRDRERVSSRGAGAIHRMYNVHKPCLHLRSLEKLG